MIKIYLASPISPVINALSGIYGKYGICLVDREEDANLITSSKLEILKRYVDSGSEKKLLLWTNEPRWSSATEDITIGGRRIGVMNCFSGDVYLDSFHYLWVGAHRKVQHLTSEEYDRRSRNKPIFFMASNHGSGMPFLIRGVDVDLYRLRDQFALSGHALGLVDIYGQGWPTGIALPENREGKQWAQWETDKITIAEKYLFNICIENTDYKHYVTEKFWHSIMSKCFPISYSGANGILDIFPELKDYSYSSDLTAKDFFETLVELSKSQHIDTVNALIDKYNHLIDGGEVVNESRRRTAEAFGKKVLEILSEAN